ncbi:hypothetical protein BT69DRAFT_1287544 [Atractiella rhizophila]|nr:hypothetical protein BT69DRAFT_1287544 [Atractiella rhizophila]
MSVDCLKDAKIRWANPEGLETLVIKGCIGGSGGMGIWTPEKVTNAIAGWDTVKMRKPSSWNSEEANGNASEEDVLEFIPGRGRGMCKKLRLLLGGASRVGNPAGGLSLDWSDLQVRKVRDVAKLKNCEFRVKYGEIIIWKDEPAIS